MIYKFAWSVVGSFFMAAICKGVIPLISLASINAPCFTNIINMGSRPKRNNHQYNTYCVLQHNAVVLSSGYLSD